jgi:hypothetical protein
MSEVLVGLLVFLPCCVDRPVPSDEAIAGIVVYRQGYAFCRGIGQAFFRIPFLGPWRDSFGLFVCANIAIFWY